MLLFFPEHPAHAEFQDKLQQRNDADSLCQLMFNDSGVGHDVGAYENPSKVAPLQHQVVKTEPIFYEE